jgi:Arc/MetJ-type ribon-helix-helix transcriptional regulator
MKFSANIPDDYLEFLDQQVDDGHYRSRSAALTDAIAVWRTFRLTSSYTEAFAAADPIWDLAVADGLDDEHGL